MITWSLLAALVACVAGCAPFEQLTLPDPVVTGSTGKLADVDRRRPGVRLGEAPSQEAREGGSSIGSDRLVGTPRPRPMTADAAVHDGVSISLSEASIQAAARAVLGDQLQLIYTVSDKVKGTISLHTPRPVSREGLLELFEAALQAQGAAMVRTGTTYQILPIEEAVTAGAPLRPPGRAGRQTVGVVTEVMSLRYVSTQDMERLLKPIAPRTALVKGDPARNVLLLTGTRTDLATIADAVSIFDVDWMRGMSFAIVPLEQADPDAIAQELDAVFSNDRDGPGRGMLRFIANRRLKAVLVVSPRREMLARAEVWIRKLDAVGQATEKQVHVYHVQNRPAIEVAQLLQRVYVTQDQQRITAAVSSSFGVATAAPGTAGGQPAIDVVPGVPLAARPANGPGPLPGGPVTAEAAAAPGDTARAAAASGQQAVRPADDRQSGIQVVADEQNNAVIVTATGSEWKRVRQVIERIDIAPAQVLLEATIAEVTLNDQLKLGLRWYFDRGQSHLKLTNDVLGAVSPVFPGFSYFLNSPNVQVVLNTLANITDVNVVSSPTLTVLDNKKAVLQVGDEVPVATQSAVSVLAPGAPVVNSIAYRNTGIILGITPRVSDEGRVLLDIEQEVSDVLPASSPTVTPTVQQRRVRTTVAVLDGESVVLAGMIQDRASREREQVPILGSVPVIGNLFKNKSDTIKRTELLIAVTPRIIIDRFQARGIVEEFRGKLNFHTRPQRVGPPSRREQLDRLQR